MARLTCRDSQLLGLLGELPYITRTQAQRLYFPSEQTCRRRLNALWAMGEVKRGRKCGDEDYVYCLPDVKLNGHTEHGLLLSEFYVTLIDAGLQPIIKVEPLIGKIRPDAIIEVNERQVFVEVESGKRLGHFGKKVKAYSRMNIPVAVIGEETVLRSLKTRTKDRFLLWGAQETINYLSNV